MATERYGAAVARAVHQFSVENRALLRHILMDEGIDCDYREQGYLALAMTAGEWETLSNDPPDAACGWYPVAPDGA